MAEPDALLARLVELARVLRHRGVAVGPGDVIVGLDAARLVGVERRQDLRAALRASWCHQRGDLATFDRAFTEVLEGRPAAQPRPARPGIVKLAQGMAPGGLGTEGPALRSRTPRGLATADERLRRVDFGQCSAEELAELEMAVAALRLRPRGRRSRAWEPDRRGGGVDWRRSFRSAMRHDGEWVALLRRRRRRRPRPLLLVCDVSGSMERYARVMVRFLHATQRSRGSAEAFVFGTRLTRVSRELRQPTPQRAMAQVAQAVPDWSGGTRIGDCLHELLTRWGGRALARGPITLVLSDGWETGDTGRLAEATARLQRLSRGLIWCNPRMGDPQFRPEAAGMRAALPHVDRLQPVHNLERLAQLTRVLQEAEGNRCGRGPSVRRRSAVNA